MVAGSQNINFQFFGPLMPSGALKRENGCFFLRYNEFEYLLELSYDNTRHIELHRAAGHDAKFLLFQVCLIKFSLQSIFDRLLLFITSIAFFYLRKWFVCPPSTIKCKERIPYFLRGLPPQFVLALYKNPFPCLSITRTHPHFWVVNCASKLIDYFFFVKRNGFF